VSAMGVGIMGPKLAIWYLVFGKFGDSTAGR